MAFVCFDLFDVENAKRPVWIELAFLEPDVGFGINSIHELVKLKSKVWENVCTRAIARRITLIGTANSCWVYLLPPVIEVLCWKTYVWL